VIAAGPIASMSGTVTYTLGLALTCPSEWRARRDSNPRPSDPKSASRQGEQRVSIRAWNGHRKDAVLVDSGVSLDPAPERVLVPSREPGRVRCPRSASSSFKCPRREGRLYASP
jgi:hypothetical protein